MARKILGLILGLPFAILLFLAFAGALVALFGGLAGLENAKSVGGTICGIGALGFFVLLLSPFGELFALMGPFGSNGSAQTNINASAQPNGSVPGKKEDVDDRVA